MIRDVTHDPVALVEAAIDAFRREAWDEVPPLCHPASLGAFKAQQVRQYDPRRKQPAFTVEQLLRFDPDMPRAVAEYNVAQRDRFLREWQDPARALEGITSVEAVRAASPAALFAAWLRAHAPSRELDRAQRERGLSGDAVAQAMAAARDQFRFVVLGAVPDGLHVAHVLYRDAPAQDDGDAPDEARASHDAWRAQQTDDEREVTRLVAGAYGPRLVMCLRRPDGAWALHAEQHLFGLGNFTVGVSFPVPEGDDPLTPE
ncbi:MAG TPA: hypothetical protein VGD77_14600 [Gemmatimonadaceae bacterium]